MSHAGLSLAPTEEPDFKVKTREWCEPARQVARSAPLVAAVGNTRSPVGSVLNRVYLVPKTSITPMQWNQIKHDLTLYPVEKFFGNHHQTASLMM